MPRSDGVVEKPDEQTLPVVLSAHPDTAEVPNSGILDFTYRRTIQTP